MPPADPKDPASPKLADFLCFAIYSANLAYGRAYKPILEELGLTYTQYIAIVALWEEDHQTVSGLGEKLFLESNTLTPILKKLEAVANKTAGVRRWGAAALDLAFVAAGRYDAFFEYGLSPWDVAAGILMVREAGGLVNDVTGGAYVLGTSTSILATNAGLRDVMVEILA